VPKSDIHVSFILSTINRASYLEAMLKNIREFIASDDELIIVDAGSTDNTLDIVDNNRDIISTFVSEKDKGPAHGYNKALLMSSGQLIMNINDDDYFFPNGVRQAIKAMDDNQDIDVLTFGGEVTVYNQATCNKDLVEYQYLPTGIALSSGISNFMKYVQAGFLLIRRRIIPLTGLFDVTVQATDTQFFSQLLLCGANFKYLNVKVFRHTAYPHSSQNNVDASYCDRVRILMRHGDWCEIHKYRFTELCGSLGLNSGPEHYYKLLYKISLFVPYVIIVLKRKLLNIIKITFYRSSKIKEPTWDSSIR
jgi:glycosyltransferase involved in cell wall biosynthesis